MCKTLVSIAALALSLGPLLAAQTPSAADSPADAAANDAAMSADAGGSTSVKVASDDDAARTARTFTGKKVRSSDQKELGEIKDLLVDPQSGKVRFAVVSTGGFMGIADRLRAVPFTSLDASGSNFTVPVTPEQWDHLATINDEQFEEGAVTLEPEVKRQEAKLFAGADLSSGQLLRATKLRGREVKSGDTNIGSIDGVVIDRSAGTAVALLAPSQDVAAGKKFLVPMTKLTFSGPNATTVTTQLTRVDLQSAARASGRTAANVSSAQQGANVASDASAGTAAPGALAGMRPAASGFGSEPDTMNRSSSGATESETSGAVATSSGSGSSAASTQATGQSGTEQHPAAGAGAIAAAQAVRRALDQDPLLATQAVRVIPQNNKLVLEGTVTSGELKAQIENKAHVLAGRTPLESHLTIQTQTP